MKMVKSLLLGSAAGLVAVTAGQAADLPVKAKPVEYVKICSLYGAGFYYMPGTDMCIKIGGWVRAEISGGQVNGNITWGPFNGDDLNRTTSNLIARARGYITADAREQTAYGTARAYIAVGLATNDAGLQATSLVDSANRAFVAMGRDDRRSVAVVLRLLQRAGGSVPRRLCTRRRIPATAAGGCWAYTAQLGNGSRRRSRRNSAG